MTLALTVSGTNRPSEHASRLWNGREDNARRIGEIDEETKCRLSWKTIRAMRRHMLIRLMERPEAAEGREAEVLKRYFRLRRDAREGRVGQDNESAAFTRGTKGGRQVRAAVLERRVAAILCALSSAGRPLSCREIAERMGMTWNIVRDTLRDHTDAFPAGVRPVRAGHRTMGWKREGARSTKAQGGDRT